LRLTAANAPFWMFALEKVGLRRCVRHAVVHLKNSNTTTDGGDPERPYLDIDAAEEGAGPGPWSSGPAEKVVGRVGTSQIDLLGKSSVKTCATLLLSVHT
jgi:hypothetical protein